MSAFSLGKLDAICARLTSFQQPQSARTVGDDGVNLSSDQSQSARLDGLHHGVKAKIARLKDGSASPSAADDDSSSSPYKPMESLAARTNGSPSSGCHDGTCIAATNGRDKTPALPEDGTSSSGVPEACSASPASGATTVSNNNNSKTTDYNTRATAPASECLPNFLGVTAEVAAHSTNGDAASCSPERAPSVPGSPSPSGTNPDEDDSCQSSLSSSSPAKEIHSNSSAHDNADVSPTVPSQESHNANSSENLHTTIKDNFNLSYATATADVSVISSHTLNSPSSLALPKPSTKSNTSQSLEETSSNGTKRIKDDSIDDEGLQRVKTISAVGVGSTSAGKRIIGNEMKTLSVERALSPESDDSRNLKAKELPPLACASRLTPDQNLSCVENGRVVSEDAVEGATQCIPMNLSEPLTSGIPSASFSCGDIAAKGNSLVREKVSTDNYKAQDNLHTHTKVFPGDIEDTVTKNATQANVPHSPKNCNALESFLNPSQSDVGLTCFKDNSIHTSGKASSIELSENDNGVQKRDLNTKASPQSKHSDEVGEDKSKAVQSHDQTNSSKLENIQRTQMASSIKSKNFLMLGDGNDSTEVRNSSAEQTISSDARLSLCNNNNNYYNNNTSESRTENIPPESVAATVTQPLPSSQTATPAGRRKSRKAARPQKQPARSHLVMDTDFSYDISDSDHLHGNVSPSAMSSKPCTSFFDVNSGESGSAAKDPESCAPRTSTPLDLSTGDLVIVGAKASPESHERVDSDKEDTDSSIQAGTPKGEGVGVEFIQQQQPRTEYSAPTSSVEPSAETKGLVDFAHNTMQELLGIYGLDAADARGVHLNRLKSCFRAEAVPQPDAADVSVGGGAAKPQHALPRHRKSLVHRNLASGGAVHHKPRPFRKNVYTSLTHHAVESPSSSGLALSPVPDGLSSEQFQLLGNSSSSSNDSTSVSASASTISTLPVTASAAVAGPSSAAAKRVYMQKPVSSNDLSKYIRRYASSDDCGSALCEDMGYKDHYHCLDCQLKVFVRKEEMVRHYKWHKKRQDSLQHGFMRYSPVDDCSVKYRGCAHNGRQTHYHCVQGNCDKVYVSTSDVQMHANFHRKDSAIIQEGFQRFRATEDCGTPSCAFYGHRTTHFHCRRLQCNYTFKNKADMEKHKSYHQKDEVLSKDGFKKFMKYEACPYPGCRFSKINNHIHCIRPGCQYVLHSTAQLYSHKRKHERREFENAYRSYRHLQQRQQQQNVSLTPPVVGEGQTTQLQIPLSVPTKHSVTIPQKPLADVDASPQTQNISHAVSAQRPYSPALDLSESPKVKDLGIPEPPVRASMALPVKVLPPQDGVKEEGGMGSDTETMEPEDLSLPHRKRKLTINMDEELPAKALKQEQSQRDTEVKTEDVVKAPAENSVGIDLRGPGDDCDIDDDEDEDDDDDDDDDDDKDYGQVEEPTLVNPCFSSSGMDGEQLEDSVDLTPAPEAMSGRDLSIKQEIKSDDGDIAAHFSGSKINSNHETLVKGLLSRSKPYCSVQKAEETAEVVSRSSDPGFADSSSASGQSATTTTGLTQIKVVTPDSVNPPVAVRADASSLPSGIIIKSTLPGSSQAAQAFLNPQGRVWGLHIPIKLAADKRERDESWKKFLVRYTANDACFARCPCLYKDHYHCRIEGCKVTFKSKDGVRGHARFHELQDSITPLIFHLVSNDAPCQTEGCPYSGKESHYHCNWIDCNSIIPKSAPTFARLEHYRIHECTLPATNRGAKAASSYTAHRIADMDPFQKRRGRPPKYNKYQLPIVPKAYLTEQEITDSTLAHLNNQPYKNSSIINGFRRYQGPSEQCPDPRCIYRNVEHFHCGRKQCHMATDRLDVLNLHAKDFHNNVIILDGFEFFERVVDCRRPVCHNKRINRHYHCMRPRCDYSFVRHSTMAQHNKKHPTVTSAVLSPPLITPHNRLLMSGKSSSSTRMFGSPTYVPIAPAVTSPSSNAISQVSLFSSIKTSVPVAPVTTTSPTNSKTVVKSAGTFFPLSGLSNLPAGALPNQITSSQQPSSEGQVVSSTAGQIVSGTQVIQTADGSQFLPTGSMCLAIPQSGVSGASTSLPLITSPLPLLAGQGNKPGLITGLIPVGQLSPLVSVQGGQLVATSQAQLVQQPGTNVVRVLQQSPGTSVQGQNSSTPTIAATNATAMPPLAMLLQHHQQLQQQGLSPPLSWAALRECMHFSVEHNCGRPFCKLKKKDHFHCLDCNQAFSDPARLRSHIGKHGFKFKKSERQKTGSESLATDTASSQDQPEAVDLTVGVTTNSKTRFSEDDVREDLSSSLNLQPSVFTSMVSTGDVQLRQARPTSSSGVGLSISGTSHKLAQRESHSALNHVDAEDLNCSTISSSSDSRQDFPRSPSLVIDDSVDDESSLNASSSSLTLCSSLSRKSSRKRTAAQSKDFISSDSLVIPKPVKHRKTTWGSRSHSDVPEGYKRVRCGEDCGYVRCAYRQTVTHFHCLRSDCGYGFSDKSRIMQHTMRHERLDLLMGNDFQQFRASVSCQRADCEFDEKASHFHCLKCPYSCADSSKVPAHRKYHTKLDNINSNGFTKFSGTADCQIASCSYFRKQTHYHCTHQGCNHAVLGPSQMAPHKLKHVQHRWVK